MSSVLIVEDEQVTAMEIQAMIQDLGYEISGVVDTGEKAIESVDDNPPDAILMDIRFPGEIDGIEAVEAINKDQNIPVVYLTAHSDEDTLSRAKQTRPKGYLVKPITERDLRSSLEMVLLDE